MLEGHRLESNEIAFERNGLERSAGATHLTACWSWWREGHGGMLEMEASRFLVGARDCEQLRFLEKSAEESERDGSAIVPETVRHDHRRVASEVRRHELRQVGRACRSNDYINRPHQVVPLLNRDRANAIGIHVIHRRDEACCP